MVKRKICIVTGTRAEYGLLYWLMKEIQSDEKLCLQIVVTGAHLSPEFGLTYKIIEKDGFIIDAKVEMLLSSDTFVGVTKSLGLGVIGFADVFDRLKPDILVLLGDRYEMLAVAQVALVANIPVAHISGGEETEGAIDNSIRNMVTKVAHLHFVEAEPYRKRIIQLGEDPHQVFNFGSTGVEMVERSKLLGRSELEKLLKFNFGAINFLVTYHPETLSKSDNFTNIKALFNALDNFPEARVIITKPNADVGGMTIAAMVDKYASRQRGRVLVSTSLGQQKYLAAMRYCDVVIGNSSSGIIEAPVMHRATVNIGVRQKGRLMAKSIISCDETTASIVAAIRKALSPAFKKKLSSVTSLYGSGYVSRKIKNVLKRVCLDGLIYKKFYDAKFYKNG